jgi:hypothetical protein
MLDLDTLPTLERHAKCLAAFAFMLGLARQGVVMPNMDAEQIARSERVREQNQFYWDETVMALAFRTDLSNDERLLSLSLHDAEKARLRELYFAENAGANLSSIVAECAYEMGIAKRG